MQTFAKKRIEILIERALLKRLTEKLERTGVSGYSVAPVVGGRGRAGRWEADGQVGAAAGMFVVWCIVDPVRLDELLQAVFAVVAQQVGLVSVGDVEVVRPERF
ncbi:nitrogen regulatory protein P-II [Bradyrhizobium nitroreducens]|uniref:Nitrogen regulatory protein P-II n=1 Tax=Bradyrhizobium nitroreducens TaxID=709803 RepID=A0A2M6UJ10_9BRAD|nr:MULTISPECIES: transcriptional regulator [Bradyrhizobium]PIT04624.1 nitrogen regulatory protein P-II [Bradyrhizobium nitroreducens]TQF35850.1 nitrogen regulatory protein P-II [Bradyrhizobium sp. UNPF46]